MPTIITEYLNGRKPADFVKLMKDQQVDSVIDVRFSAKYPEYFTYPNIHALMRKEGNYKTVTYQPLGNPSWNRPPKQTDWNIAKKTYLEYIQTKQAYYLRNLVNWVSGELVKNKTFCLICYCPTTDPRLCHRFWLQEFLITKISGAEK